VFSGNSSGSVSHLALTHLTANSQGPLTLVEGQIDESVTGVTLVLSDGEHVQATTGNGWLLAWWPGSLDATSAEITTASGTTSQNLTRSGPRPGGPGGPGPQAPGFSGTGNS
jgi:hypothetical protein